MNMFGWRTLFGYLLLGLLSRSAFAAPVGTVEDPELTSGYFEGDINVVFQRNGVLATTNHWPNATVYYNIETFDELHVDFIKHAMNSIENASCIRFVPADNSTNNFVNIKASDNGCWSNLGFNGGVQHLQLMDSELETGCFRLGTVQHELLHTLGFSHQHSASERDNYIEVNWENISPGAFVNFQKLNETKAGNFGVKYDYGSVMHYPTNAFAKNMEMLTIKLLQPVNGVEVGQRIGMSESDLARLNNMYKCEEPLASSEGIPDEN